MLVVVDLELLAHYEVHQGTDQHPRLVLGGLDIDDRAIYELHHLLKQPVGVLIKLLEEYLTAHVEHWMMDCVFVLHEEGVPLAHDLVGQVEESRRVELESQTLSYCRGYLCDLYLELVDVLDCAGVVGGECELLGLLALELL